MERRYFLKALGLISASATIPSIILDVTDIRTPLPIPQAPEQVRMAKLYDTVIFKDGTQARVIAINSLMKTPTVTLIPVAYDVDLGNGMGMKKDYDQYTLPDLVEIVYSQVFGESSRKI